MKRLLVSSILPVLVALLVACIPTPGPTETPSIPTVPAKLAEAKLDTLRWATFLVMQPASGEWVSQGTAVLVSADGVLYTAFHVVDVDDNGVLDSRERVAHIYTDKGKFWPADVTKSYPDCDIAVLQFRHAWPGGFQHVEIGYSSLLRAGDTVFLLGYDRNPWQGTFVRGQVLAVGTDDEGIPYMAISAAIHKGCSGGPVVDTEGRLVGIIQKVGVTSQGKEVLAILVPETGSPVVAPATATIGRTPLPGATEPSGGYVTHVVQPGDTLSRIARQYGCSVQEIVTVNNIRDPNKISVGQGLRIPRYCHPAPTPTSGGPRPQGGGGPPLELTISNFYIQPYEPHGSRVTWFQLELTIRNISKQTLLPPWYPLFLTHFSHPSVFDACQGTFYYGKEWGGVDIQQQSPIGPGESQTWAWGTIGDPPTKMVSEALGWRWTYTFKARRSGQATPDFEHRVERIIPGEKPPYYCSDPFRWGGSFPRPD